MATQTALLGVDYTGYDIQIDTTDIDKYALQLCKFAPDTTQPVPTPKQTDIATGLFNYVVANLQGVTNIAINKMEQTAY